MFFRTRKPPPLHRRQALECIPVRNPEARESRNSDGILLSYPVEVKPWFQGIFRRMAGREPGIITRKLQLDTMGSSVWEMIDNRRSVREIAELFAQGHRLGSREAEISVSAFLRELGKRGLIVLRTQE
ncbi:MAG TPA: PqqD family protein [Desulfobulbus sp.]|nr:PqqD family protein [Desulfobulbus sp.]